MAFSAVSIGAAGANKGYFLDPGHFVVSAITIPSNPAHIDPVTGLMPCCSEAIGAWISGGPQYLAMWDNGLAGGVTTAITDPPGGADAVSTRTYTYLPHAKIFYPGIKLLGVISGSGGVGIYYQSGDGGSATVYTESVVYDGDFGGNLNIGVAYNTVPSVPLSLSAVPGSTPGSIDLSWSAPASNGGLAVNGYRLQWSTDNFATIAGFVTDTGTTATTRTITGLTAGATYKFRVAALNAVSDAFGGSQPSGPYFTSAAVAVLSGAKRWDGSNEVAVAAIKRWDGSAEVTVTTAVRWNGSAEVPLS